MNKKPLFLSFLLALLCLGSISLFFHTSRLAETARGELSSRILRFHVLANSDSEEDQALKLSVKEALLDYIEAGLPQNAGLKETKDFLLSHEAELRTVATDIIGANGYDYPVEFKLEPWYFPTKTYGDLTFPCGTYEAFRVLIGNGEGKNWWCVLYPSLCFVDATYSVVPDESKDELKSVLDEDTYHTLLPEKPQVRFKLIEWLNSLF